MYVCLPPSLRVPPTPTAHVYIYTPSGMRNFYMQMWTPKGSTCLHADHTCLRTNTRHVIASGPKPTPTQYDAQGLQLFRNMAIYICKARCVEPTSLPAYLCTPIQLSSASCCMFAPPPSHLSTKHPHSIKPNHLLYYSLEA